MKRKDIKLCLLELGKPSKRDGIVGFEGRLAVSSVGEGDKDRIKGGKDLTISLLWELAYTSFR